MTTESYKKCVGCDNTLDWAPQSTNQYTQYCMSCKKCTVCQELIGADDLSYCVKYKIDHAHLQCIAIDVREEIENRKVTVSEKHLEYLNIVRLMIEPNCELSPATNQHEAEWRTQQFVTGMSLEQKFLFLKRIEAIAATCSILLKKDRKTIEIEINKKEREKYLAATSKQDGASREQKPNKTERKKLTAREKAIAALMAIGLTEEMAAASVDSKGSVQ